MNNHKSTMVEAPDSARAQPVRTPTQQAFETTLRAINAPFYRPFFASRPMTTINGNADSLEKVRLIAEAAGLYTHFTPALTSLQVWGFDQLRVTFTPAPTVAQVPVGHQSCDHCTGYGPRYESLPTCRDCGDAVCASCQMPGSLHESDGESRATCTCKTCWQEVITDDLNADADLDLAHAHREEN